MKQLIFIVTSLVLLTSCEKTINLNLDNKSGTIVIEGNVTNLAGPYFVRLTRSVAFTEPNRYPAIANAMVIMSDNMGQKDTLQYVSDGQYKTNRFVSVPGYTYQLQVSLAGVNYLAQSTLPKTVLLDSLVLEPFTFAGTTIYNLLPVFTDPQTLGDRYLFILSVNSNKDKSFQTFSDNFNNGLPNQRPLNVPIDGDDPVSIGDTIHVEMQSIDQNMYAFYTGLEGISAGGGVTPANPPGNISNGALGYFSAHSSIARSIIIK